MPTTLTESDATKMKQLCADAEFLSAHSRDIMASVFADDVRSFLLDMQYRAWQEQNAWTEADQKREQLMEVPW